MDKFTHYFKEDWPYLKGKDMKFYFTGRENGIGQLEIVVERIAEAGYQRDSNGYQVIWVLKSVLTEYMIGIIGEDKE